MPTFQPRLMDHVLPSNATSYERTLASQVDRLLSLDIPIRELWNPWTCPENLLPYLAWALSVDIWDSTWPLAKRRSVVANAIAHHKIKGTLQAIETYLGLIDTQIIKAQQPAQKLFSGPSLTKDQREAWLEKLPQIRVWRNYGNGTEGKRLFPGGERANRFFEGRFPQPNAAMSRLALKAKYVVNGVETDQTVEDDITYFRVFLKTQLPYSIFCNTILHRPKKFLVPSIADKRIITIEPTQITPWRSTVGPQLEPVQSQPENIAQPGHENGHAVFSKRVIDRKKFYVPSTASYRMYARYPIYDASVEYPAKRPSIQFMGVGRYGIKPKTAELKIAMRQQWSKYKARINEPFIPRTRFWTPHDGSLMLKNRQAIIAAKRLTDQILLDTNTKPGFLAGLPRWAGDPIVI
jgi:hypothetical protein